MTDFLTFRGTRPEVEELIRGLASVLSGRQPDVHGVARRIQLRAGVALLSEVQQDFLRKSRGERGRDGILWPALKPETIARRRTTAKERKAAGVGGKRVRGFLTPAQDREWRRVFRRAFYAARADVGEAEAKRIAGAAAWKFAREAFGYRTRTELFGNRKVDVLRDTGELLRALTPGVEAEPSGAPGQIFEVHPGRVVVGVNKKAWHHKGDRRRGLPARPLWPDDGIPEAWVPAVNEAVETGVLEAVRAVLGGG